MRIEEIRNLCKGDVCYLASFNKTIKRIVVIQKLEVISKGRKYITLKSNGFVYGKRAQKIKFDLTTNELLCASKDYDYTLHTIKEVYDLNARKWASDHDTRIALDAYMENEIKDNLKATMHLYKKVFGDLIDFKNLKIEVNHLEKNTVLGRTNLITRHFKNGTKHIEIESVEINIEPENMDVTTFVGVMFHELGHVLHCQQFQFEDAFSEYLPIDGNVWDYAKTNYLENFAVAVQDAYMCNQKTKKRNEFIYNLIDNLKNK